jgi:hypothetical protein
VHYVFILPLLFRNFPCSFAFVMLLCFYL